MHDFDIFAESTYVLRSRVLGTDAGIDLHSDRKGTQEPPNMSHHQYWGTGGGSFSGWMLVGLAW